MILLAIRIFDYKNKYFIINFIRINAHLANELTHCDIFKKHDIRSDHKSILIKIKINTENDKSE